MEKHLVEAADDRFFSALNAMFQGRITEMEALWSKADDVVYMGPQPGLFHVGWKVTDQDWVKQADVRMGGGIEVVNRHVTLGEKLAVVHHVARSTNQDPQGHPVEFTIRGTNVFRLEAGDWKLIAHHSDPLPFDLNL